MTEPAPFTQIQDLSAAFTGLVEVARAALPAKEEGAA